MNDNQIIQICNFCSYNDEFFMISSEVNIISVINCNSMELRFIPGPEDEFFYDDTLYGAINIWNSNIILAPYNADKIWVYNTISGRWTSVFDGCYKGIKNRKFSGIEIYNEKAYIFGCSFPNIVCVDMSCLKGQVVCGEEIHVAPGGYVRVDDHIYIVDSESNSIYDFNLENEVIKKIVINCEKSLEKIASDGETLWITTDREKILVRYVLNSGEVSLYSDSGGELVSGITLFGDSVLVYGPYSGSSYVYNTKSKLFEELPKSIDDRIGFSKYYNNQLIICGMSGKNYIYRDSKWLDFVVNISKEKLQEFQVYSNKPFKEIVSENRMFGIKGFIELLNQGA